MLLVLDDEHKHHLSFLVDASVEVVKEFSRISVEFIKKGTNAKVYQAAASKLGVSADTVQHGVEGLMHLLTESTKLQLSDMDFTDSMLGLGFSEELQQILSEVYQSHRQEIRLLLFEMAPEMPQYRDLEWRLDIQIASRTLRHQADPQILMKLHLKEDDETKVKVIQTDPANLVHLTKTLEGALQEMKTAHCRRLLRNL